MDGSPLPVTRVLVIDDSVVVRRVATRALAREPTIEVLGAARNGRAAVAKAQALRPDIVVLDSETAATDGFATLDELRRSRPELPVVIFHEDATRALVGNVGSAVRGATSFACKPRTDGIGLSEGEVLSELMPAIRRLGVHGTRAAVPDRPAHVADIGGSPPKTPGPFAVIVIAVSTGGPDALAEIVGRFPAELPVPVLVVQHMPPDFTRLLAERLDRHAAISVVEASDGEAVQAGRVYIAPGGRHMALTLTDGRIAVALHDGPRENSCRPAADVLFRSAAQLYRERVLAVVLTGMGTDGLRGAEAVRAGGGWVIAQTQCTSTIGSMPGAVAAAGLANTVVRLEELGHALTAHALRSSDAGHRS
jgi:two-component system chemotaxis response regulator CheB